jgi:uncharacterized protein YndB with AHSA1/START domain
LLDFALAVPVERLFAAWSDDALRECRLPR